MMALYQAGENLTQEFDKVTVLYLGRQVFFGTMANAKTYFEEVGFICNPRQTTADFLTAVTDPHARRIKKGWETRVPRTPDEFVREWEKSSHYAQLSGEMQQYDKEFGRTQPQLEEYQSYHLTQKAGHQRKESVYMVNLRAQLVANLKRAFHRLVGDRIFLATMAFSSIFISLIMGSMFYNLQETTSSFYSKGGVLFFSVLFNAVQALSEIGTQYAQRPIVQRQETYAMYHPFVDAVASMVAQYPYKLLVVSIFDLIIYFMANLKREVGAFFIFWITTYLAALAMSGYFRTVAAVTKKPESAMGLAGVSVLAFAIYAGYVIPKPSMHPWFKWITYIDPLSYAFETLVANEFHGVLAVCTALVPSGPGLRNASPSNQVCAVTGAKPGQAFVNGDDYIEASFSYYHSHVGRNTGILCAFVCGFTFMFALATEFNSLATSTGDVLVFRKGHEPENVRKALQDGKVLDDVESQVDHEALREIKTNISEIRGLVQSKDVFIWEQLSYDIATDDGEMRRLLNDVSGYVKPGTLTALIGESGAGKTTLLNVLAQRIDVGVVHGHVSVNNSTPGRSFRRQTGYVQQQDVHLPESTVREALRFSAALRQPKDVPIEEKFAYVEKVIEILEMQDYAEAVIGVPGNGLNLEQRKRTTIGVELAAKPTLLFVDEPTSGLDSQSAWSIVRLMRKLANAGQATLCTIHQPSSVVFDEFDRLLLLTKGGKTVFFGDIGDRGQNVIDYFESNGAFSCPTDANPAEYILDVIGAGTSGHADRDWNEVWMQSTGHREALAKIQALRDEHSIEAAGSQAHAPVEAEFAVSWFSQYRAVQSRIYLHYWRNPTYIMGKVFLNVAAGLFVGFTFYKEGNSVQGLQNKVTRFILPCQCKSSREANKVLGLCHIHGPHPRHAIDEPTPASICRTRPALCRS
jgi:ATP-binding cassette subfamily G (WHITE) protein 2 (SNQ2)